MLRKNTLIPHHLRDHHDLQSAITAALAAGKIIKREYSHIQHIEEKGIGDLVSAVDREADAAIATILQKLCPNDPILSEELHPNLDSEPSRLWIVDPLDGTAPFLFQLGKEIPCVLIALREQQETTVGVGFFPLTGELFCAVKNHGAYRNGKKTTLLTNRRLTESWIEMNQYGDVSYETEAFAALFDSLRSKDGARLVTVCSPNSGVALRLLDGQSQRAAVIHDNNPTNPKQCAWDTAAIQLIIEESGGVMLNAKGERYDPFTPEMIVVGGKDICLEIVERMKE